MTAVTQTNRTSARREPTKPWFDADLVARAVAQGEETVVVHGIRFTIEIGHYFTERASKLNYECAFLRREDGDFAPMGYVRLPDA